MWILPSAYCQGMQGKRGSGSPILDSGAGWTWLVGCTHPGRSTRPDGKHRVGEQVGSRPCLNVKKNRKIFARSYTNRRFLYCDSGKMPHWRTSPCSSNVPAIWTYASCSRDLNDYNPVPTSRKQNFLYNFNLFLCIYNLRFMNLYSKFYTNVDKQSVMMTHKKRSKHVVVVAL